MAVLEPSPISVLPPAGEPASDEEFSFWRDVRKRFRKNRLAVASLAYVVFLTLVAIAAPLLAPYGYDDQFVGPIRGAMSAKHWPGTDSLGRDMLPRLIYGARVSISVALAVVAVSTILSLLIGGLAGYFSGVVDSLFMRVADVFLAVPYIAFAFAMVEMFGRAMWVVVLSLVLRGWMGGARTFRGSVMQVKALDYIETARASGCTSRRILTTHILPNAIQPLIVAIGFSVGAAILTESVYSFLGVGFTEPTPAWGILVAAGRGEILSKPHLFLFPAMALMITVLAFVFVAEGVRDALDPRLR